MTFRNYLSNITLGMLGACLLVTPAQAQDKTLKRKPEGPWQIKNVESTQEGENPYCVMIQSLNSDGKLTVSRNKRKQTALALDVGKPFLDPSRDYALALKPSNGGTYRFNVSPLSGSEFIIRMSADDEAIDRIRESERMRISFSDRDVELTLPDMAEASRSLSNCVAGNLSDPTATRSKQTTPDKQPEDLAELRAKNEELRQSLKQARKKLEDSQAQSGESARASELKEKVRTLESRLAKVRQSDQNDKQDKWAVNEKKLADLKAKLAKEKSAREKAKDKIDKLRQKLSGQSQVPLLSQQDKAKLQDKLERLNQEKELIQQKYTQLQQDKSRLEDKYQQQRGKQSGYNQEITSLRIENKSLKKELSNAQDKLDNVQEKLATRSAQECKIPEDEIARNSANTQKRIDALENRLSRLQKDNRRLQSDLSAAQSRPESASAKKDKAKSDVEDEGKQAIAQRYHEAQREIRRLGSKLRKKRQSCEQEVKKLEEMLFDPELAESKQISVLNKLEGQLKQARAKIEKLKTGNRDGKTDRASSRPATVPGPVQSTAISQQQSNNGTNKSSRDSKAHQSDSKPVNLKSRSAASKKEKGNNTRAIEQITSDLNKSERIYTSTKSVTDLLSRSGIGNRFDVSRANSTGESVYAAYQWDQGPVYGSAKFRKIADKKGFSRGVDRYLAQTRSRCSEDFSARPAMDDMTVSSTKDVSAYDIACVGNNVDNAASILFVRDSNNNFGVIAFEASTAQMSKVMRFRDAVLQTIASAKTAQR